MNRDLVLSAIAAAALHGGLLLGFPKGKPPVKEIVKVVVLDDWKPPQIKEDPPDPIDLTSEKSETKEIPREIIPRGIDTPTIPGPTDFTTPLVPVPAVNAPNINQITENIVGVREGIQRDIYRPIDLDRVPKARFQIAPVYPYEAKQRGMTGTVQIEFTVDESGRVSDPRIVDSPDRMFNEPTIAAVLKWRFEPGLRHNKTVRFRMIAPVVFNLND